MAKNPLREPSKNIFRLNHEKNKNFKAWPMKGVLMKKKSVYNDRFLFLIHPI